MLPPFRLLQETLPSLVRKFLCFHWATQSSETRKSAWGAEQGRQGQARDASGAAAPCSAGGRLVSSTALLTVANTGTEQQTAHLESPRGGDSGVYMALSTAPFNAWSPSYSEMWPSPPTLPLTCSFSKTFFFGLSSSSGSPPS